jgi:hypothetical protein
MRISEIPRNKQRLIMQRPAFFKGCHFWTRPRKYLPEVAYYVDNTDIAAGCWLIFIIDGVYVARKTNKNTHSQRLSRRGSIRVSRGKALGCWAHWERSSC